MSLLAHHSRSHMILLMHPNVFTYLMQIILCVIKNLIVIFWNMVLEVFFIYETMTSCSIARVFYYFIFWVNNCLDKKMHLKLVLIIQFINLIMPWIWYKILSSLLSSITTLLIFYFTFFYIFFNGYHILIILYN